MLHTRGRPFIVSTGLGETLIVVGEDDPTILNEQKAKVITEMKTELQDQLPSLAIKTGLGIVGLFGAIYYFLIRR